MITVEEALSRIQKTVKKGSKVKIKVDQALGMTLAEVVYSPIDMPPFPQSAMDGYALRFNGKNHFNLIGEIKAGDGHEPTLQRGEAVRIFTGAPVPSTADAVVRQEDTHVERDTLFVDPMPKPMANVRPQAEQILKGDLALEKGHVITSASIGYLATLGIREIMVYQKPVVSILVTGNELIAPGQPLQYGQIYESNATMLVAALAQYGIDEISVHRVKDDFQSTKNVLKELLANSDVVLCSGGISVGDYDFVGKALIELGVEEVFYKVKQKPGKPLFFGEKDALVFALPGNPAAALTCFYVYVLKALNILMGKNPEGLPRTRKKLTTDFVRKGDRAQFLKAAINNDEVQLLEGQSSAMLHTYALSNALVYVPLAQEKIEQTDEVECILIPSYV